MIEPGKTETLAMTISCHKLKGKFTRNLIIMTNDPDHSKETLICIGQILEPVVLTPKHIVFGKVSRKAGPQKTTLEMRRGDGGPIKPRIGEVKLANLDLKLNEIEPGEYYKIEATLNPPFERTGVMPNVRLETGVPDSPYVDVRVRYRIAPHVSAQPPNLRLPGKLEEEWIRTIRLVWDDDASHTILGATASDPALKLEVEDQDGEQVVVVRMAAAAEVSRTRRWITISTDDAASPVVKVPIVVGRTPLRDGRPGAGRRPGAQVKKIQRIKQGDAGKVEKGAVPKRPPTAKAVD